MRSSFPPLDTLRLVGSKFPGLWALIDEARPRACQLAGCTERVWAPTEAAVTAGITCLSRQGLSAEDSVFPFPPLALTLAQWRKDKEVFVIDPDLAHVLYEQDDLSIPAGVFDFLPYGCFYVQAPDLEPDRDPAQQPHGFFVSIGWDSRQHQETLSFIFLDEFHHFHPFDLALDGRDIAECFDRMVRLRLDSGLQIMEDCARRELATRPAVIDLLRRSLQLVLYLCAVNAEIVPDPEQRTTMRRTSGPPRDRYAEVRKWDAGFRVGAAIRAQIPGPASIAEARPAGAQTPKRPHMRRGHWHHFWIGPKSDPARRRLILKWLPPIFVGPAGEELPVVIHTIDSKEDTP